MGEMECGKEILNKEDVKEQLLDAWLKLSSSISNHRLVSGVSFNEALICNILYRQYSQDPSGMMTATELCRQTHILKSQMNAILTSLEKKHMIFRQRSENDRRQIEVRIAPDHLEVYYENHARILQLVSRLLERISEKEGLNAARMLNYLAASFEEVIEEK
ncbi:MAG: MarR family transcriptional regulator [Lachnospiraceae bacterium]|nr:MarR family transcriptional regulator [Lachnospiraceae bacterium]MDD3796505.1 MarR family transcriptional regulator [Lachnospiraceae bacterium]